jgi:Tol biopolymer transport system component
MLIWSPDSRYVATATVNDGLLIAPLNGLTRLKSLNQLITDVPLAGGFATAELIWSPDNHYLAFTFLVPRDNPSGDLLYILDATSGKTVLTQPLLPIWAMRWTAWSPDGRYIAFSGSPFDASGDEELYLLEWQTGDIRRLTDNGYRDSLPNWSPDSSHLVFTSAEDGYNELHIIDIASGQRHQLTHATIGYLGTWSPDGAQIAFESNQDNGTDDLYLINADGSGLRRITYLRSPNTLRPGWLRWPD